MKLMNTPQSHPQIFRHRIGSRYGGLFDRNFLLGRDPFEDHPLLNEKSLPVNITSTREFYELELPVPGYLKNEVSLTISGNTLIVKGHKVTEGEGNSKNYILKEHELDVFKRKFELNDAIDQTKVEARMSHGILYVRLYLKTENVKEDVPKTEIKIK
jgi:HSP20 family protein